MPESNRLTAAERIAQIRARAEDALERIEEKWDKAMDAFHGRPIRNPQAEAAADVEASRRREAPGVEHAPTAEELALNEEYERAMWPDVGDEFEPDYSFEMIYEGEWRVPEPGVETQLLLAHSNDGYHYAVYTSVRGGDPGDPGWSKAYPTREMADEAGHAALIERHYPDIAGVDSDREPTHEMEPATQVRAPVLDQDNGGAPTVSDERTYLAVPYEEKDDAKVLGAKWDRSAKAWFVPAGMDLQAFEPWLPAKGEVQIAVEADPREEFATALRECGLQVEGLPVMNGQLQRVAVEGDRGKQRSGAYFGHLDGKPAGFIENFRTGVRTNWKTSGQAVALGAQDRARMAAEAAQKRHERALERERQYERTAQEVDAIWTAATPVEAHPYLAEKGVPSDGLRLADDGRLLVPVQDSDGKLWSLQYIAPDGSKLFHEGGRVEGGHYVVGDVDRPGPLLIAEGYATAATLYGLSDMPSIVAFNAGNLASVAQTYRALYPERDIYIAGDNDHRREAEGKPNVGREKAEEAAAKIGSSALLPTFAENDAGSDWNDMARSQGTDEARLQIKIAVAIAERETLARELSAARERDSGCEKTLACSHGLRQTRSEELELER